jgi:SAM-dependent methyltransferase
MASPTTTFPPLANSFNGFKFDGFQAIAIENVLFLPFGLHRGIGYISRIPDSFCYADCLGCKSIPHSHEQGNSTMSDLHSSFKPDARRIEKFYQNYVDVMGQTSGWSSPERAYKVYEICSKSPAQTWSTFDSVLDVGSGEGEFFNFLKERRDFSGKYTGIEVFKPFYETSVERYGAHPDTEWIYGEFLGHDFGDRQFDWLMALGTFSSRQDHQEEYDFQLCQKMFSLAKKGISIYLNDLHNSSPPERLKKIPDICLHDIPRFIEKVEKNFPVSQTQTLSFSLNPPASMAIVHFLL